ncbi:MAG: MFS transporter [Gammaproteobacteria bacterium]|nr:MFS transporter [Gammaproteobacteria bacterium]
MLLRKFLRRYPAFLYSPFRRYWFASLASIAGANLLILGQGWLVFELTGSPFQLGVLGAAAAVPGIVVNLMGGVFADRFDKKKIILFSCLCNTVLLATLALLDATNVVKVWHVYTIAALTSLVTGIDWPVRASIYPLLVRRPAYLSAVALNSFIWQSSRATIPAIGGALLFLAGTASVFAVGAAGFLTMFLVVLTIPMEETKAAKTSPIQELLEGLSFIYRHELFKWLLGLTFLAMFFVQSYVQIMPYIVELLDQNEAVYGLLLAAGGIGSMVGTLAVGAMKSSRVSGKTLLACALFSAVGTFLMSLMVSWNLLMLTFAFALVSAILASIFQISGVTIMQLAVPHRLRGRVMGFHTVCYNLIPLGGLFLGFLAEVLGIVSAIGIGCLIFGVSVLSIGLTSSTIRNIGQRPIQEIESPVSP